MELVRTVDVVRTYKTGAREVRALQGISMSVPTGVFAAFKGRSGSGKTTLLNILGALDKPTSGEVWFEGRRIDNMGENQLTEVRRQRIAYIFQSFALLPTFSAAENIDVALRISGLALKERKKRINEALDLVGLAKWARHRPSEMSGGQNQRLAIARALAANKPLILADEPTGELDSGTGRQILTLFREIVETRQVTLLMATHDPTVDEFAHIIYDLLDGQIQERVVAESARPLAV